MNRNPSTLLLDDIPAIEDSQYVIATQYDATPEEVCDVALSMPTDRVDCFKWIVLATGDLCFAYFPQGEEYEALRAKLQATGVGA